MLNRGKHLANLDRSQNPTFAAVLVGVDKERFVVHRDLLMYDAEFFRAAFTGNFKEAEDRSVTLPEDEPLTFEVFVHWMHNKAMPSTKNAHTELLDEWTWKDDEGGERKTENLIKLYVFGDKYSVADLKIDTMNEFLDHMENNFTGLPSYSQIKFAYYNLPAESPFLRYLVESYCHYADATDWKKNARKLPAAFLTRVLGLYADHVSYGDCYLSEYSVCDYHDHSDDAEKARCQLNAQSSNAPIIWPPVSDSEGDDEDYDEKDCGLGTSDERSHSIKR